MDNNSTAGAFSFTSPHVLTVLINYLRNAPSEQILAGIAAVAVAYPLLVSALRFRRMKEIQKLFDFPTRESMAKMTDEQAWKIQLLMSQLEFPFMYKTSLQFALFRTYGIPTISSLLTKTSQFSDPQTAFKRYADTGGLITEFVAWEPTSDRARTAIARVNFLHSGYRQSGKILDDDMLYTLSLFATQPIEWIDRYEWRSLTELERCAVGTFWKSIGDAMGISYEKLPSGKTGFRDGIHWLEEIIKWSNEYEKACMVPHPKNHETAEQTTAVLVYMLPKSLKPVGYNFVSHVMDDRLRKAMIYPPPPPTQAALFTFVLKARKFFLRYLALPRPYFMRVQRMTEEPDPKTGTFYMKVWEGYPYYVKPTFWHRWGPGALVSRIMGLPVPGDDGDKFRPGGYDIKNMGPNYFEGKGLTYVEKQKEVLSKNRTGGCPFH